MGQVLASDFVELYEDKKLKSSIHDKVNHSEIRKPDPAPPPPKQKPEKPKPKAVNAINLNNIKDLHIYTSQPITNEFPDMNLENFQSHNIQDGHYYGILDNQNKQGDGVLALKNENSQNYYFGRFDKNVTQEKGFAIINDNQIYGQFQNNELKGNGLLITQSGNKYLGEWKNRCLVYGQAYNQNYYYVGEFQEGLRHGFGECRYYDGTIIKGNWKKDLLEGLSQIVFPNQTIFEGHFFEGVKQGFGHLKQDQLSFYCYYDNNIKNGIGLKIEKEGLNSNNQFAQQTKYTELLFVQGQQQGLYCVYNDPQKKQWFNKDQNNAIETLTHITEKRGLGELFEEKSLTNQKDELDKEVKVMLDGINQIKVKCEKYNGLQNELDTFQQKLMQLVDYEQWLHQCDE